MENKKKITKRHYDSIYKKYADDWGIDKTIKWLEERFEVVELSDSEPYQEFNKMFYNNE